MIRGKTMVKIEYNEERIYWIMAHTIHEDGKTYVIEALKDVTDTGIISETCCKMMESMRESIATNTLYYNNRPISLTVSMGMVSTQEALDKDKLIDIADRKLYQAKQSGCNQIVY
ncbi:MAG: diguanylate cyclase [Niameybacter sp.]